MSHEKKQLEELNNVDKNKYTDEIQCLKNKIRKIEDEHNTYNPDIESLKEQIQSLNTNSRNSPPPGFCLK